MAKRNPKQEGSNIYDCKPQIGKCPIGCNQCFYNREGAFYVDIDESHMPTLEEVGDGIMRVNSGHDSNIQREKVIAETEKYEKRFFNTSVPKFNFPSPVVWTANPKEEEPIPWHDIPDNVMFIRLRVSSTNWDHIEKALDYYNNIQGVPVVLTFMAYYDKEPDHAENYIWKKRHINSYWCPTRDFMKETIEKAKDMGGRLVALCSDLDAYQCTACGNCETYYYQTIKHMKEIGKILK